MPKQLTPAQIAAFHRDGFCFPIDVMSQREAAGFRRRLEDAEARHPEAFNAENRNNAHYVQTWLDEIVHHPVILDAVEDLIGPNILLWTTVLFIKEPGDPGFVSWHQDATYWGIVPHSGITAWLALTPATAENGCMKMIPGSHKGGIRPHRDTFGERNILTRGQTIDQVDEASALEVSLRPGQLSLHDVRTVHGSRPNRSPERRIGLALQSYMPTHVHQTKGSDTAVLVRGHDSFGHFQAGRRPDRDMTPEAVAFRSAANRRMSEILYDGAARRRNY